MFYDSISLKEKLVEIRTNGYIVPEGTDAFELSLSMMRNIGSTDPELRDRLIYATMWHWTTKEVFSPDQMTRLLEISLDDEHLFYGLGKIDDDSVFMRAFSVLIVALAVSYHRNSKLITDERLKEVFQRVMKYYEDERDLRGYVNGKGWADAVCHGADALDELALCESLGREELISILNIIRDKTCTGNHSYICEEDERMVNAVVSIISRQVLSISEMNDWIESFKDAVKERVYPQYLTLKSNIKHLLRSLYFRLIEDPDKNAITDVIKETLKGIK